MYVGGRRGLLTGVQLYDLIILSASRKLRNKLATSRSWRNNFWNKSKDREADWKWSIEWEEPRMHKINTSEENGAPEWVDEKKKFNESKVATPDQNSACVYAYRI